MNILVHLGCLVHSVCQTYTQSLILNFHQSPVMFPHKLVYELSYLEVTELRNRESAESNSPRVQQGFDLDRIRANTMRKNSQANKTALINLNCLGR